MYLDDDEKIRYKSIKDTLDRVYEDLDFTDAIISSGGEEHKVHRGIVCAQSPHLKKALQPNNFQEGSLARVELKFHPALTMRLVDFLYNHRYSIETEDDLKYFSRVGAGPDCADPDQTCNSSADQLETSSTGSTNDEDGYFAYLVFHNNKINQGWLHATMYSIGDYLEMANLKEFSLVRFKKWLDLNSRQATNIDIVARVYESTHEKDRSLREALVEASVRSTDPDFAKSAEEAMIDFHEYAMDVALALYERLGNRSIFNTAPRPHLVSIPQQAERKHKCWCSRAFQKRSRLLQHQQDKSH